MTTEEPVLSTPWRSDPSAMADRLAAWWDANRAPGATVTDVTAPEGSGMSSETLLFTIQPSDGPAERLVARLAPLASQQFPVFPEYDLELQRRVMQTVAAHTAVPVPEVLTHEADDSWLGSPFLLMRRVDGVVPSDIPPYTMAGWLFEQALPSILITTSPRAWAFALIGIHEYLRRYDGDRRASQVREDLAQRLLALYNANRSDEWRWFEKSLSYCNAALPHALLMCGQWMANGAMHDAAMESLAWLAEIQRDRTNGGHFVPIGSNGFYRRGGARARFDQQPVEAQTTISACLEAYRITGDKNWHKEARRAFDWFLGRNDLRLPIYDPTTGGCRDGLHADRPNENQGAESSLAFLQGLLELRLAENALLSEEAGTR